MDRATFQQFKSLLLGLPGWNDPARRRALLRDAFWGEEWLNRLHPPVFAATVDDLGRALQTTRPAVLHFSGHGGGPEGLWFEDGPGRPRAVSGAALAAQLRLFNECLRVVVLNACYSEPQARAVAAEIEYVIGTRQAQGDDTAVAFSVGFYQALAAGRTVPDAFRCGCARIRLEGIPEHDAPVLLRGPDQAPRVALKGDLQPEPLDGDEKPMSTWQSARFGKPVHLTHHASDRMARRDLTLEMVKDLIENGQVRRKDEAHWWIFKAFPERGDNLICAAVVSGRALIVKTLMTLGRNRSSEDRLLSGRRHPGDPRQRQAGESRGLTRVEPQYQLCGRRQRRGNRPAGGAGAGALSG